ncbi:MULTISPECIES: arginyltransferase [Methylococcus]|uniref:Aspartate/glutamate leucyltransferase n=1 Tax=Methylococcus capsulatus TaxID=414 RepID=A0ABZ2F5F5_METCP|nr:MULTISPECIES: arginyltransferase [Methylococcus]MDF9393403.1 arginyltransferase [Methylococcus capsulatus]
MLERVALWRGPGHPCGYMPGRNARFAYVSPHHPLSPQSYRGLLEQGFRRSGNWVYRPCCSGCNACIPVRLPVEDFRFTRGYRRILKRNADVEIHACAARFDERQFQLYVRYLAVRHPTDAPVSRDDYWSFLASSWAETRFVEFRSRSDLLGVAVVDHVPGALSAVYTFFDPNAAERSLGSLAILWQISEACRLGWEWLYLGYWIGGCRKMEYKARYRPLEALVANRWFRFEVDEPLPSSML